MIFRRARVRRTGAGFRLNLPAEEQALLDDLLGQLRALLVAEPGTADDRVRRVFPTAYPDEPELDAEYQRYMREELVASHLGAIDQVRGSLGTAELDEAGMHRWVQSINALRLVLGTMLDVSEDEDPGLRDDPTYLLYGYLSGLLDEMIQVLSR